MSTIILFLSFWLVAFGSRVEAQQASTVSAQMEDSEGLGAVGGTSSSDNFIMTLGVNQGDDSSDDDLSQTLSLLSPASYRQLLTSSCGLYGDSFASGEATGINTDIQFSIDKLWVDFPYMSPGILATGQNELIINSNAPIGYSLYTGEDLPLHLPEMEQRLLVDGLAVYPREIIAATTCDAGDCDDQTAGTWVNGEIAGFGYTVMGDDALADFAGGQKYRAFSDLKLGQPARLIATKDASSQALSQRQLTVRYQVGVRGDTEAGVFQNSVYYTLVPNY